MAGSTVNAVVITIVVATVLISSNLIESASVQHHNKQRLVRSPSQDTEVNHCSLGTRCGWAVYSQQTRVIEDWFKACTCESGTQCVRSEDDISVSAYIYRCKTAQD